ncbi:MAG: hypothetical protein WBL50_10275 [Candidatus Acidiferrum sp.]
MKLPTKAGRTKAARARKQLTDAEFFFYENAGYSYDPKKETAEQGRIRCAKQLADAERLAVSYGFTFEWEEDWSIGSHRKYYGEDSVYADHEPHTCESCIVRDEDVNVLGSLGCIDDADSNYRRVIQAELADEATAEYQKKQAAINA